jgi:hypothetical protein
MPQTCPKCRRANPPEALYCYEDGFALGGRTGGPVDPASRPFPHPFVFPSGRACRNFNELALACFQEWALGVELLRQGDLASFLSGLGRADLARAAREAAAFPDKDRALDYFLGLVPGQALEPAKLHVEPRRVNLGQLAVGKDFRWVLRLENQGMRLLSGSVASDCVWLALGDGAGSPRKVFQFGHDTAIPVHVRGKELRANAKPLEGRLVVESNGGPAVVVVTAEVPVQPFPDGVLASAKSPRQAAEKAKANPKGAAALFESGAVQRWYQANGWTYPVEGPSASGLGAVQQFFEALGLTRPPKVDLKEKSLNLSGKAGDVLKASLEATTEEKRPVYAHAVSNQSWLQVTRVVLDGRTAVVRLTATVPDRPGETLRARLTIKANGNQRFDVPVTLAVTGAPRPAAAPAYMVVEELEEVPAPATVRWSGADTAVKNTGRASTVVLDAVPDDDEDDEDDRPRRRRGPKWLVYGPAAFLAVGLLIALVGDVVALVRDWWNTAKDDDAPLASSVIAVKFHDTEEEVLLGEGGGVKGGGASNVIKGIWDPSMRFGLAMVGEKDPRNPGKPKRLTFEEKGLTNNTVVRLDYPNKRGGEWIFGEKAFHTRDGDKVPGEWPGRWVKMSAALGKDEDGNKRNGKRSVWYYDDEKVQVTQTVELVAGDLSGQPDTCIVSYKMENQDSKTHKVGIRFLLDTYIGANDGVPFLIPGQRRLIDTDIDEKDPRNIPAYIQACESQDLAHPGTIARIQFRVDGLEPPSRVTLGAWPDPRLGGGARQEKTLWEVPVFPIRQLTSSENPNGDSCVVMYWPEQDLAPGKGRLVGFAYGLGDVSSTKSGKLGLTAGGSFIPNGEITVTAYVNNPGPGETATLTLPDGFQLAEGTAKQVVPAPGGASQNSPVTWKVTCGAAGEYTLKVDTSGGASQTKKITVKKRATIY